MANVSVTIAGAEKENVSAITVGNRRWGDNGENWGAAQDVAPGRRTLTVYMYPHPRTISVAVNIPPEGIDLEVVVD